MMIDVPTQFVEPASVQSQVYVLPSANWDISRMSGASAFVLKADPEDFQTLEWEDMPTEQGSATGRGTAGKAGKAVKAKKRAVIRKHGKAPKVKHLAPKKPVC